MTQLAIAEATDRPQPMRDVILDAAERLFAERGFSAVSMRDIVAETPLKNQASLYHHFQNKQALYEAVLARGLDHIGALLPDRSTETLADLHANLDRLLDYLSRHPHLARLIQRAALDDSRYLASAVTSLLRPIYTQGRRALAGADEIWDADEIPHLAAGLYMLIFGYFANATLLQAVVRGDPLGEEAVQRQRKFVKTAVARLLGIESPGAVATSQRHEGRP
ncbi:MAG: TetR family transcriptional regulator [Dehalococcoidia bacterium]